MIHSLVPSRNIEQHKLKSRGVAASVGKLVRGATKY